MASSDDENVRPLKRFRKAKTREEEEESLVQAVPKSTRYKNQWAVNVFESWRELRVNKVAALESTTLNIALEDIEDLDVDWTKMSTLSLDFWIGKLSQEVSDQQGKRLLFCFVFLLFKTISESAGSKLVVLVA